MIKIESTTVKLSGVPTVKALSEKADAYRCLFGTEPVISVRGYFADGSVHYVEHYQGGRRHDGRNGEAAVRKFRLDGSLRHELHYHHGSRQ